MSVLTSPDYEGIEKEYFLPQPAGEQYAYDLLACFANPAAAAKALEALHQHGFAEADTRLLGTAADIVGSGVGVTEADGKVIRATVRYTVAGAAVGALLGAGIGLVILAIPAFQAALGVDISAGSYLVAAILGAMVGSGLGLVGGVLGLDRRHVGESQYTDQRAAGITMIGVHARDDLQTRTATEALRATGAVRVQPLVAGRNRPECGFPCVGWSIAEGEFIPCAVRSLN
jgi:hypothetical protein